MAGYFWEASHLEVNCVSFCLFITPELLFGHYLLYYFRVFERQIGSNKYSVSKHLAQITYELKFNTYVLLLYMSFAEIISHVLNFHYDANF